MAENQELAVRDKKELVGKEEKTVPGRYLRPLRRHLRDGRRAHRRRWRWPASRRRTSASRLENDVLRVEGRIDFTKYDGHGAGLHRVQRRPLRALLRPVEQDRPGEDQRPARRRRADADLAEGEAGAAAADRDPLSEARAAGRRRQRPRLAQAFETLIGRWIGESGVARDPLRRRWGPR